MDLALTSEKAGPYNAATMPKPTASGDEQPSVRLKPLFGIAPRRYVPAFYGALLVLLLFAVLVLPGITNNGEQITFRSSPAGAEVFVDGVRIGATPHTEFVSAGTQRVTISRAGFADAEEELNVRGGVLGSLLFPSTRSYTVSLTLESPEQIARDAARSYSLWSLVGDATAHYQFPPVLSDAVRDLTVSDEESGGTWAGLTAPSALLDSLLRTARADVRSTALLKDYVRASLLAEGNGAPPSGFAVGSWIAELSSTLESSVAPSVLMEQALPDDMASALTAERWYQEQREQRTTDMLPYTREADPLEETPPARSFRGARFRRIPGGTFVMGLSQSGGSQVRTEPLDVPHVVALSSFFMMEQEVDRALYGAFLAETPRWRPSNRQELIEEGLVSKSYLEGWTTEGGQQADGSAGGAGSQTAGGGSTERPGDSGAGEITGTLPVTNVSHHAASAFAAWFSRGLPAGYTARLPREAEWEWSAYLNGEERENAVFRGRNVRGPRPTGSGNAGAAGLYHMLGNVWEWQREWYRAGGYALTAAADPGERAAAARNGSAEAARIAEALPGAHRVVRGGSWANRANDIGIITRGSQAPDTTSPYLGFRLVVTESE